VVVLGAVAPDQEHILTVPAQVFLATLQRCFNGRRKELLARRDARQQQLDAGVLPDFLPETRAIREDDSWRCAPPAPGLVDRCGGTRNGSRQRAAALPWDRPAGPPGWRNATTSRCDSWVSVGAGRRGRTAAARTMQVIPAACAGPWTSTTTPLVGGGIPQACALLAPPCSRLAPGRGGAP
jgi:hypothetical protein